MKAALYVRVSTKDQTTATQEAELRRWADRLGLEVTCVYSDTASGARGDRTALVEVLAGAHRREFDMLLVWALDRLSREGIGPMTRYLDTLRRASIRVLSHQEPWLDSGGPAGDLLLAVFAWVAQQERKRIGERVRAGQARARVQGVKLGRKTRPVDLDELQRRRRAGQGWRRIARAMRVPTTTLRRRWKECQKSPDELRTQSTRFGGDFRGSGGEAVTHPAGASVGSVLIGGRLSREPFPRQMLHLLKASTGRYICREVSKSLEDSPKNPA